jgi:O-antigen ligase
VTAPALHPYDLDPSLFAERTYSSRRRRRAFFDVPALISLMIVLTFLLPTRLVVPQLTGFGRPALVVGLLLTGLWVASKAHPVWGTRGPQPIRWAAVAFLVSLFMSYAAAYLRGLPPSEANGADSTVIATVVFIGTVVATADFVPNRARVEQIVRTVVWFGGLMALIGLAEFVSKIPVADYIKLPGLVLVSDMAGLQARGDGFLRVASTATHYIEFSTVMAMVLPFAIHVALFGASRFQRQLALVAAAVVGAAIPVALSRTGILALFVGMIAMFPVWSWRVRFNIGLLGIALIGCLMVVRPGLLGTIASLFRTLGSDPSIKGRTDDYAIVSQFIDQRPIFGRGFGTFLPDEYLILDNQYLQTVIGGGYVGLIALLGLHITAIFLCVLAYRRSTAALDRHLCGCLIAVQLIALTVHATFDSFGFSTFLTLLALFTGLAGAMWRLTHPARQIRSVGRQDVDA